MVASLMKEPGSRPAIQVPSGSFTRVGEASTMPPLTEARKGAISTFPWWARAAKVVGPTLIPKRLAFFIPQLVSNIMRSRRASVVSSPASGPFTWNGNGLAAERGLTVESFVDRAWTWSQSGVKRPWRSTSFRVASSSSEPLASTWP